jgi:5'-methylthioadenosine phosphorylase
VTTAKIGVIGGSGFYHLFGQQREEGVDMPTPYGFPSEMVTVGEVAGTAVAFIARHGATHTLPPHRINYRANLWALAALGVTRVIAPCAAGSLRAEVGRGDVVVCDQLIDATKGRRNDTFFDGPDVAHLSAPSPYCPELRATAVAGARAAGLTTHEGGTVVVIEGPRFSTAAESRLHRRNGAHLINMTQYPEAALARELGMCYAALALITDYDAGVEGDDRQLAVTQEEVFRVFAANVEKLRDAVLRMVSALPAERGCDCAASRPHPIGQ